MKKQNYKLSLMLALICSGMMSAGIARAEEASDGSAGTCPCAADFDPAKMADYQKQFTDSGATGNCKIGEANSASTPPETIKVAAVGFGNQNKLLAYAVTWNATQNAGQCSVTQDGKESGVKPITADEFDACADQIKSVAGEVGLTKDTSP